MPSLGADMDKGTVVEWRVHPGDEVKRGDIVAVVQTDKSDIEVETFTAGIVEAILVPEGEEVAVGSVLARLRAPGEPAGPPLGATGEASPLMPLPPPPLGPAAVPVAAVGASPAPRAEAKPELRGRTPGEGRATVLSPMVRHLAETTHVDLRAVPATGPGGLITRGDVESAAGRTGAASRRPVPPSRLPRIAPRARRLAVTLGVDLDTVTGTGPGGAVTGRDVERSVTAPPAAPRVAAPVRGAPVADRQASLRTAVANLMARSKREIPHYYLSTTVDLGAGVEWLEQHNVTRDVTTRLLPAALLLKATVRAAQQAPEFNGFWVDGAFQPQPAVHLGVAVALRGGGLLAPTIRSAELLTLDELMAQLRQLVGRARSGSLRSGEMSPPTITVTNLGDEGVDAVFPIIYPPQVAMVGFGKISQRPWAADGMLGIRPVVTATLAADHRASDGRRGARFLALIDRLLQDPEKL